MVQSVLVWLSLLLVYTGLTDTEGARILGVFPVFAPSHHVVIQPILRALVDAGHQLVVYSPFPLQEPPLNYTDILIDTVINDNIDIDRRILDIIEMPHWKCIDNMLPFYDILLHGTFESKQIQKLLKSQEKFDLIITEPFVAQEFTFIFGHIFKVPTIGIQTFFTNSALNFHLGNSLSMTSIPDGCFPHSNKMIFWQRFLNAFSLLRGMHMYYRDYIPTVEWKMRKYFPDMPPLLELTKNISLMFINDHLTADYPQPRPPTMVPVAGIHIAPEKPLPKDVKKFMDDAKEGVILFSLGTLVPDEARPKEYFDMLFNVFSKLPQKVLWKTRKEGLEGVPENVKLVKWMPQRDLLAHSHCLLFITHGGLASQHETIYNGVPVVGIPFFGDQHRNVGFYVAQEIGVRVLPNELSEETLSTAIAEVLGNPKYRVNIKRLSRIFHDRPMTPAQSVVFWTEYVLRHSGAAHLKPVSAQLSWYQLALLDVSAVVLLVIISSAAALYFAVKTFLNVVRKKPKNYKKVQ